MLKFIDRYFEKIAVFATIGATVAMLASAIIIY